MKGKPVFLFFGYTNCPDVCPVVLYKWGYTIKQLGPQADSIAFIFVTQDPWRDTPDVLKAWVARFDERIIMLTGSPENLEPVWRAYSAIPFYTDAKGNPIKNPDEYAKRGEPYFVTHLGIVYVATVSMYSALLSLRRLSGRISQGRKIHPFSMTTRYTGSMVASVDGRRVVSGIVPPVVSALHLVLFSYLSGAVQYFTNSGFAVQGLRVVWVFYESASYSGPGLQFFWDSSMFAVRLFVLLLGVSIASLVYVNLFLLFRLWSRGLLYSCLIRGAGTGLMTAISALASATYICCGWAPTVAVLRITLASAWA